MATEYTEEQLNNFDKATLVQLFLAQQSQLHDIDQKLQLLLEQVAVLNNNRFGRSSEKLETENQISFLEVDGNIIYFNEAEAVENLAEYEEDETTKSRGRKAKGKRAADIQGLPVIPVEHRMTEEELVSEFGEDGWYQLEDEIYNRYRFTPMKVEIEEHHVGVYKSKKDNHFKKANHPSSMIICMKEYTTIMYFRQMKSQFWSQKRTELREASITCGCIEPAKCIRINRSVYTSINHLVMQAIQEHF